MEIEGSKNDNGGLTSTEKDDASFLRERFLFLIASLPGKACQVGMENGMKINANLRAFDVSFENILVENLTVPSAPETLLPMSILRTQDVHTIFCTDI
ncbi:uncharacterized protein [Euwallacea fornicatus]|uniref:uncharacterized protein n=1 Tax=Euwallacea fornicatus TaxID=995702 RepID=UPI00338D94C2